METSRKTAQDLKVSFPVLSDPSLDMAKRYGVVDEENGTAWPAVFIVTRSGRVAWRDLFETYKERPPVDELLARIETASPPAR